MCQLRDGSTHQGTVTSMEPNEDTFVLHSESTKVMYLIWSTFIYTEIRALKSSWCMNFIVLKLCFIFSNKNWAAIFISLAEGENKACSPCWCSWSFSSPTQTRWVFASSSRHSIRCGCLGIPTKLFCSFWVITRPYNAALGCHTFNIHFYSTTCCPQRYYFFLWFLCNRYLYDILTNSTVVKKKIPVLICCNKTDKVTAHTKEFIRKQMEKEMYVFQVYLFLGVWYFG